MEPARSYRGVSIDARALRVFAQVLCDAIVWLRVIVRFASDACFGRTVVDGVDSTSMIRVIRTG